MLKPPPLRNDCFALPAGVEWTPVADALCDLKQRMSVVVEQIEVSLSKSIGRILAADVVANRASPPRSNTAVDGYGFAHKSIENQDIVRLPLVQGRAAAGDPYRGIVPDANAIRILTGAVLPEGVDTVILQEDVNADDSEIVFHGPLKKGANTRQAGEDVQMGQTVLSKGRKITAADAALMASVGVGIVSVFRRLKVGVLSTGDELRDTTDAAGESQIYDANRPMLLALIRQFGFEVVDLGIAPDDRAEIRARLDAAAEHCDVILTSGGASAGDEDHISALLKETGSLAMWRIAIKPGRPLALGVWNSVPVFGLPGNPVAAMTCTCVFARPAMTVLAGGDWHAPQGFMVPADFEKNKKAGRREFLRARIGVDGAEVFKSEGSGRISGLSWATGFVELGDEAQVIKRGDPVRFIPFGSFD